MSFSLEERYEFFRGQVSYRDLAHGAARWLTQLLIATPAAKEKLAEWVSATPPPWATPSSEELQSKVHYFGDFSMSSTLAGALERLPPPVRDYALERVSFMGIGWQAWGFCGPWPPRTPERPWLIVASIPWGRKDMNPVDVFGHELSHAWLNQEPSAGDQAMSAFAANDLMNTPERIFRQLSRETVKNVSSMRRAAARRERLARALTRAWGFRGPPPHEVRT